MIRLPLTILVAMTAAPAFAGNDEAIPPNSTPEQIEAFKGADGNSDGALSKSEFRLFVDAMADQGEPTAKFIRTFSVFSIAFAEVDADRDGYARPFEIYEANSSFEKGGSNAFRK